MVSHIKERIQRVGFRDIWTCAGGSKRRLENIHNEDVYDILRPIKRYYDFQITEDEMHGARTRKRRNAKVLVGSAEGKGPL
jgi:hypothetical protein